MRKGHFALDTGHGSGSVVHTALAVGLTAGLAVALTYSDVVWFIERVWRTSPDYSHGYFVLPFVAYLIWTRLTEPASEPRAYSFAAMVVGVLFVLLAMFTRGAGVYVRAVTLEVLSMIPCLIGVALICGGWQVARLTFAPIAFLVFMVPLPRELSTVLSGGLQRVGTQLGTFGLQLVGIPAVAEGNVIQLSSDTIGVAEACSGIRMLVCFIGLTVGTCMVIRRPMWEKVALIATSPAIAIVANVIRLVTTGIAFEFGGQKVGQVIFHDLAGWLMIPIGLVSLLFEMTLLSRILIEPEARGAFRAIAPPVLSAE